MRSNEFTIKRFQNEHSDQWEAFIPECENGTIFHTRKFLSYHAPGKFTDYSLLAEKNGKICALLPAAERAGDSKKILHSHLGASYGGIVYKKNLGLEDQNDLVTAIVQYCRENRFTSIIMTPPPIIYHSIPSDYLEFCLFRNGFSYQKREISSVLDLRTGTEALLADCSTQARRAMRKAEKSGVIVKDSREFSAFYDILEKNLSLRHNVTPTHTPDELSRLRNLFPSRIKLLAAFTDNRMIGGVVSFKCNRFVNLAFYISHNMDFQQYRPVDLLFKELMFQCVYSGFRYLDFGLFTVNADPNWGLVRFKEKFGTRGIFRNSLKIDL